MKRLKQGGYITFFIVTLAIFAGTVFAQTAKPVYPIRELGNCRDAKECYLYCEIPVNKAKCWSYGKYKLDRQVLGERTPPNITFPIAELGNCVNVQECRSYCENPDHYDTCMNFAKKHGLHRENKKEKQKKKTLVEQAKTEIGCTSESSCRTFCDRPSNYEKCRAFAERHGLHREGKEPGSEKARMLEKARADLGCDSMESCRTICEQDRERCMDFARRYGFREEDDRHVPPEGSPDGCRTPEECERYCREHKGECKRYFEKKESGEEPEDRRYGPRDCDDEESCRRYCEEHPDECSEFKDDGRSYEVEIQDESSDYHESPESPSGCKTEEECRRWCKEHPDECPGFKEASDFKERQDYSEQGDIPREEEHFEGKDIKDTNYKKYYDNPDYPLESYEDEPRVEDSATFD